MAVVVVAVVVTHVVTVTAALRCLLWVLYVYVCVCVWGPFGLDLFGPRAKRMLTSDKRQCVRLSVCPFGR